MQQSAGSYLRIPTRTRPVLCALCPDAAQLQLPHNQPRPSVKMVKKSVAALSQAFKTMQARAQTIEQVRSRWMHHLDLSLLAKHSLQTPHQCYKLLHVAAWHGLTR
jgi:hypothetical protein